MGSLGWPEILLIALVVLLLFGARKLPEIGRGLGEGIRSFRSAMKSDDSDRGNDGRGGGSGSGPK
jgi:sec-independent protein translocase protein TatA